jgi:hypothetical protein
VGRKRVPLDQAQESDVASRATDQPAPTDQGPFLYRSALPSPPQNLRSRAAPDETLYQLRRRWLASAAAEAAAGTRKWEGGRGSSNPPPNSSSRPRRPRTSLPSRYVAPFSSGSADAASGDLTRFCPRLTCSFLARTEEPGPAGGALHQAQGQDRPRRSADPVTLRHQVDRSPDNLASGASITQFPLFWFLGFCGYLEVSALLLQVAGARGDQCRGARQGPQIIRTQGNG